MGFLSGVVGFEWKAMGITPKFPFGAILITNVGGMGIDEAYAPFSPYARTSIVCLLGSIRDAVIAVDGKPTVRKVMNVCITMDHRFLDGAQASVMNKCLKRVASNPQELEKC